MYRTIEQSGLFNASWYRAQYGASTRGKDPLWHYLDTGWKAGADPSPCFDTSHYLESYADVCASGTNPLFHFLEYGKEEGRLPVRFLPQALSFFYPDARDLPVFLSPIDGAQRLTVVVDAQTLSRRDTSLADIALECLAISKKKKRRLRVISVLEDPSPLHQIVSEIFLGESEVDMVYRVPHQPSTHYPIHKGEIFVATSWTSAFSLRRIASDSDLFAFLPDCNRKMSSLSQDEERKWALSHYPLRDSSEQFAEQALVAPASFGQNRLIIASNPDQPRLHILLLLQEIERLSISLERLGIDIRVSLVGLNLEPLSLLSGLITNLTADEMCGLESELCGAVTVGEHEISVESFREKGIPVYPLSMKMLESTGEIATALEQSFFPQRRNS